MILVAIGVRVLSSESLETNLFLALLKAAFAVAVVIIYYRVSGFNDICTPTPSISYSKQSRLLTAMTVC